MDVFKGAKRVGESHVVCVTVARAASPSATTSPTSRAARSSPPASSPPRRRSSRRSSQAITGGTGAYRNAHGQLTVSEAGPQPATLTFQIS